MSEFVQLDLFGDENKPKNSFPPKELSGLTVYKASAGSGKTYTLTMEYLKQALADGNNPRKFREILAVTFTNKATDEMKTRIINTLNDIVTAKDPVIISAICNELDTDEYTLKERAKRVQRAILHNYSDFSISTIDKFFQKIIHVFVREAGLRPGFRLELDQDRLMDEAIDRMMLNLHKKEFLYRKMSDLVDEQMEKGSTWDVRRTLKEKGGEVFKEQFREFDGSFHQKIRDNLFMDGFNRSMSEIVNSFEKQMFNIADGAIKLIETNDLQKSDFYYGKNGAVNHFYKLHEGKFDLPGARIQQILNSDDDSIWMSKNYKESFDIDISQITSILTMLLGKAYNLYNKDYTLYSTALCIKNAMDILEFLAEIELNVREVASNENLMPISETTHLLGKLISDSETPFIYERAGTRYSTFMMDEFQDTSDAQWRNFKPLLKNSLSENKESLVVGDVKQAVYRWRNGDWRILAYGIFKDFSEFVVSEKNLDTNWRSFPNIIEFNNAMFSLLPSFVERNFTESNAEFINTAYKNAEQKVANKNKDKTGYVSVYAVRDTDEIKAKDKILTRLPKLIADIQDRGYKASDIAILVRKAADGQAVSDCLLSYKRTSGDTKHSFDIISPDSLFICKSSYVQFIISLFKAVINSADEINNASINYFLNKNNTAFDWNMSAILNTDVQTILTGITSLSLPEVFEKLVSSFNLGNNVVEIPYLQELHDEIISFSNNEMSDISAFLEYWDNKGANIKLSAGQTPNAINILTIHKAKGLEYPIVIIPYCNWQMKPMLNSTIWVTPKTEPFNKLSHIPVSYGNAMRDSFFSEDYYYETMQSLVDNLNLLYVAFTRAKEELHVMLPLPAEPKHSDNSDNIKNTAVALFYFLENSQHFLSEKLGRKKNGNEYYYALGKRQQKEPATDKEFDAIFIKNYNSATFDKKLRLKYESENYFTETATPLQLRNYGNLMHKVFSLINSVNDIPEAIKTIEEEGLIPKEQVAELRKRVNKAVDFAGNWFAHNTPYKVITEKFLLLPASYNKGMSRRPDRIMSSANETLVIDYKFGQQKEESHKLQVANYINLLESINYPNVKGYIWYVDMGIRYELP